MQALPPNGKQLPTTTKLQPTPLHSTENPMQLSTVPCLTGVLYFA
jgi:hypothetical protein